VGESLESQNESLDGNARFHFVFYRVYTEGKNKRIIDSDELCCCVSS